MAKKKVLVIDEKRWLNAGPSGGLYRQDLHGSPDTRPANVARHSSLLSSANDKMCCLGFACVRAGVSVDHDRVKGPSGLYGKDQEKFRDSFPFLYDVDGDNSAEAYRLMDINDSPGISDAERRKKIKRIFQRNGVKVTFVK